MCCPLYVEALRLEDPSSKTSYGMFTNMIHKSGKGDKLVLDVISLERHAKYAMQLTGYLNLHTFFYMIFPVLVAMPNAM